MRYIDNPIIPYLLFIFYMFHQLVMPDDTPLQTLAIVIFLTYALIAAVHLHKQKLSLVYLLDIFLLIQLSYFFVEYYSSSSSAITTKMALLQIKSILVVIMPIYTYFWYGLRGILTKTHIIWFSVVFIGLSIPQFYYLAHYLMENTTWVSEYNDTTNNTAYYFIQGFIFMPLIAKNKKLSLLLLIVIVFYLLLGVKRGAIVCFVCALPFYLKFFLGKTKWYTIPLIVVLFIFAANWMIEFFSDMEYFQIRIEQTLEGNSSSRDVIYGKILDYVFEDNLSIQGLFFGHGFNASLFITGQLAHNDWLELLSGFGLFAVFIYLGIMIQVIRYIRRTADKEIEVCLTMGIVIWFLQTFFSMAYASTPFQFIIIFGLCGISLYKKKQRKMEVSIK